MNYKLIIFNKIKSPAALIKIIIISIVFSFAINNELDILKTFSFNRVGESNLNVMLFITHIFTYFEAYAKYMLIGLILLIPDIIDESYLTHQIYLSSGSRKGLFGHVIKLISIYIVAFVLWFVLLTLIFSLFQVKLFDFSWPHKLMNAMYKSNKLILIKVPISATNYPLSVVLMLIILRTIMGFLILALAAFYASFRKNNAGKGISLVVAIFIITDLMLFFSSSSFNFFGNSDKLFSLSTIAYKYTLGAFFTFENVGVDFINTMIQSFIYGTLLISTLLILIRREINKKDLC